ncbi:MAG: hypothetical protein L6M37_06650 [Candidatus Methylarchaceae archaeon HK02M1]|nr:hypothetical protein [Candidatus Methylarchaceae archaeon HK02M1]
MSIDSRLTTRRDNPDYEVVSEDFSNIRGLTHDKISPQLEVPSRRQDAEHCVMPNRKEGLNSLYKSSAILWLLLCNNHPSLRVKTTYHFLKKSIERYRYKLYDLSDDPECLDYPSIIDYGYMKEKHWVYAAYMATITSLPLLYQVCKFQEILKAIFSKTSFGANIKLLDNLNDEIHDVSQAVDSLWNWLSAHTKGEYINRSKARDPIVTMAENSAFKMETWVFEAVSSNQLCASEMYGAYLDDAIKWVKGQADSLKHKVDRKGKLPSIKDYIIYISEKSIGDLWVDIDLCFFESGIKSFKEDLIRVIKQLKIGNSLVFKSSLVYDDVQDIYEDLKTKSINSAVILALERGVISQGDLKDKSPHEIVKKLKEEQILMDTIRLADMVFLKGIEMVNTVDCLDKTLDRRGLIQGFRFVRLFNLRKLLIRNKDYETMKLFFSSLDNFDKIKRTIPDDIMKLQRYLV